jgi:hypothetical protein
MLIWCQFIFCSAFVCVFLSTSYLFRIAAKTPRGIWLARYDVNDDDDDDNDDDDDEAMNNWNECINLARHSKLMRWI